MRLLKVCLFVSLLCSSLFAATIRVPQDQSTIQAGIDAAVNGDTVLVGPGVYDQPFDYHGKAVLVKSEQGLGTVTFTSAAQIATLVKFHSGEDTLSVLDGFVFENMVTNGSNTGVISLVGSSGTIRNCRFRNNWASPSPEAASPMIHHIQGGYLIVENNEFTLNNGFGGSIYIAAALSRIVSNVFKDNVARWEGSAIVVAGIYGQSTCLIEHNLFLNNRALGGSGSGSPATGGAIFLSENSGTVIRNNTFVNNNDESADGGAIGIWYYCSGITIENNIFVGNTGFAVANNHGSQVSLACNDAFANTPDNYAGSLSPDSGSFSLDPVFCDTGTSDYSIRDTSACAPANNSCGVLIGAYGIGCANIAPQITSPSEVSAIRETSFVYRAISSDPDGPSTLYSFESLPHWLNNNADSVIGVPSLEDDDTSFTLIVSDGFLADTQIVAITVSDPPYAGPVWHIATSGNDSLGDGSENLPFRSIQRGINAAANGDTVLVDDGHYYEHVSFLGKKIIVASNYLIDEDTAHIAQTIIDGDTSFVPMIADTGCVVRFVNGEDSTAILTGFTVQNAIGVNRLGSGILCDESSPQIIHCRVITNSNAGIYVDGSGVNYDLGPDILSCTISHNLGSGILLHQTLGGTAISHCDVSFNNVDGITCTGNFPQLALGHSAIFRNTGVGVKVDYWMGLVADCEIDSNAVGMGFLLGSKAPQIIAEPEYGERTGREVRNVVFRGNSYGLVIMKGCQVDSCLFEGNLENGTLLVGEDAVVGVSNSVYRRNGNPNAVGGAFRHSGPHYGFSFTNTLFDGNIAAEGGAIACRRATNTPNIDNCTFVNNIAQEGSAIFQSGSNWTTPLQLTNSLVADNSGGPVFNNDGFPLGILATCTNIFGNEGGDWIDTLSVQFGTNGNISADPLFCDTASSDYTIRDSSPCAPLNNSCGTLIGAYGIGCANAAPALTSSETVDAYSGLPFSYQPTATDADGPSLSYAFLNRPSWLIATADSVYGTPPLTDADTSFLLTVSDGFLADSQIVEIKLTETPLLTSLRIEGDSLALHVLSHLPTIGWQYHDLIGAHPQTQYEIAVGSDSNWSYAELWNPAPFNGDDSAIVYAGAGLIDGQTYWLRARVRNDLLWSNWKQTMFRLNSLPTIPTPLSPVGDVAVSSAQPTFVIRNSSDAENDSLRYIFEISSDSTMAGAHVFEKTADADTVTSALVDIVLDENARYFWRVKASDYYEESGYSAIGTFWVNSSNSAPSAFDLTSPPNTMTPPLATKSPTLDWTTASDLDPLDHVTYTLHLALDSNFAFVNQIAGLDSSRYTPPTPLEWGTRYWWKVRALDLHGGETWSSQVYRFRIMTLGDANGSGAVSISDAVFLIAYIFGGGPAPNPLATGDANCNGAVSISDVVYLINYIFAGGPAPCEH